MKHMIISIILAVLLCSGAASLLFAGDFGLSTDGAFSLDHAGAWAEPQVSVKASLWGNTALTANLSLEATGSYAYSQARPVFIELDQLQLQGNFILPGIRPAVLKFKLGRFAFSDFSAKVFAHKGDGFLLDYSLPGISISLAAAYTGFLQQPSSSILMSLSDVVDRLVEPLPLLGPFGSSRVVELLTISFTEVFARQTLVLSAVAQQDLRPATGLAEGSSRLHTAYVGFGVSGPLTENSTLFYNLFAYGNTGTYGANTILAGLAGGSLNLMLPALLSTRLSLELLYASGDADHGSFYEGNSAAYSTMFVPITMAPAALIFSAQQSNVVYLSLLYSIKPFAAATSPALRNIMLMVKPTAFLRATTGAISAAAVKPDATGSYLGTELDINILARPFSDFGFSMGAGLFVPSDQMENETPQVRLTAALSFTL